MVLDMEEYFSLNFYPQNNAWYYGKHSLKIQQLENPLKFSRTSKTEGAIKGGQLEGPPLKCKIIKGTLQMTCCCFGILAWR